MLKYKLSHDKIQYNNIEILPKDIVEKLNTLNSIETMCKKHDIKELGGNLRFLADYFDDKDRETGDPDSEVQVALHKSANILSSLTNLIEGKK
jgi:hypothetical protein